MSVRTQEMPWHYMPTLVAILNDSESEAPASSLLLHIDPAHGRQYLSPGICGVLS